MKRRIKRTLAVTLLFLLSTLCFLTGVYDGGDRFLNDTLYTSLRPTSPNIFVIGIDSDTLDRYGPWGSWSRKLTADLIDYLNADPAAKPAVIGVDIMFFGNTTDREDGALVAAAKNGGNMVLASQVTFSKDFSDGGANASNAVQKYEEPFDALRSVSSCGIMNVFADPDGVVRRSLYEVDYNGEKIPSFAGEVTRAYAKRTGQSAPISPPVDENGEWFIPFAAKPGEFFGSGSRGTSWVRVMDGEIPRELFADSIVLVGPYSAGMMDSFFTSSDHRAPMYGVEIHANTVQSLLEGNFKQPVPGYCAILIAAAVIILLYLLFSRFGVRTLTLSTVVASAAYFGSAVFLFQLGWMLPISYPILTFVFVFLSLLITNYILLTAEKASLYDQMQRLFVNSIRTIANTIDAKDPCTSGHCERVAEYSLMLGRDLQFSKSELDDLEYAALLHDVGKIGVSDNVLKKDGPLTEEEYGEMKTHPVRGAVILNEVEEFRGRITDGAKYHHERYDGRGYCEGLSGENIPLFGRIIALADAYDAMTQNRPYRRRMPMEEAIEELRRNSGTQFDPDLDARFIHLLEHCPPPAEHSKAEPSSVAPLLHRGE